MQATFKGCQKGIKAFWSNCGLLCCIKAYICSAHYTPLGQHQTSVLQLGAQIGPWPFTYPCRNQCKVSDSTTILINPLDTSGGQPLYMEQPLTSQLPWHTQVFCLKSTGRGQDVLYIQQLIWKWILDKHFTNNAEDRHGWPLGHHTQDLFVW